MTDSTGAGSVHRLIDMVVEEVSLVDRAANQHRFLIVKRDDAMDQSTLTEVTAATIEETPADGEDETGEIDDSPLGAAVEALESLTDIVALLSDLGGDATDPRLPALASQLREAAQQVLSRLGISLPVEQRLAAHRPKTPSKDVAAEPATEWTAKSVASLSESFRALSETVKQQQQQIARMQKQFGLPNSAAPAEQVAKAEPEAVGWPLDLNKPMSRENVDKALSFHDL